MQCPVILLADPDAKYLRPLELKFLEELSGKIELVIITDKNYFNEYFSQPKTIGVLLIDEQWYCESLEQHNIGRTFVLTDNHTGKIGKRTVQYIFKYSSSNEIYKSVLRVMEGRFIEREDIEKETKVIVVTSASGGVGKTTLSLGIASCLASRLQKVLYIDAEHIHTFQYWFEDCMPLNDAFYSKIQQSPKGIYEQIKTYIGKQDFYYIPPFKAALVTLGIPMDFYRVLIQEAKESGDYDAIVVDTDSIFDANKAFLMTYSDVLITVLKQTKSSVYATDELLKNIRINSSDKYLFVCNDFDEKEYNALVSVSDRKSFIVNEYIHHIKDYDTLTVDDMQDNRDIQKLSYLVS